MKSRPSKFLESCRIKEGALGSNASYGNNGAFEVINGQGTAMLVIASDQLGWEHVSVTILRQKRTPTWEEMDFVKSLFWRDTESVMQLHVPRDEHINNHPYALHLWRPTRVPLPRPPAFMVGVQRAGALAD